MRTTSISATGLAFGVGAVALATLVPATAHADTDSREFSTPSGNIRCSVYQDEPALVAVNCQLETITYTVPVGQSHDDNSDACPGDSGSGRDFRLVQGAPGFVRCSYAALNGGFGPWPTLAYGDSLSFGAITCDSAPTALTCTDTSSGHFFRLSRDFYEVG